MIVENFKTEFVRTSNAKILGRGRLALTLNQLIATLVGGMVFNLILRQLPLSNWFALIGVLLGVWLGSGRAGATVASRLVMPLIVRLRQLSGRPHTVNLAAEWDDYERENRQ